MSTTRQEHSVVGAVLAEPEAELPPTISRLLDNAPESFDDPKAGLAAVAIRTRRQTGKPADSVSIAEWLIKHNGNGQAPGISDVATWASEAPPLSLAEVDAADVWEAYQLRQAETVAHEMSNGLRSVPHKATTIVSTAIESLQRLQGETRTGSSLTLRTPSELLAMTFDDSDVILGDRLLATGQQLVIAAQGGSGKSRLLLQMAACVTTGRKFLALDTSNAGLRWLILQTENSNRRLQQDLRRLQDWLGDDWPTFAGRVVIHTIESDTDGFVSLDSEQAQSAIADAIQSSKADVVCVDPLNDFAVGDLNTDRDMKATLATLSRVCRKGNPFRALVVLHHALTGKAGALRVIGYDRSSFGRNSKALFAWTRGQINLAPVDPDTNDRLVVACGKLSNGREFPAFAVKLNESGIYEPDPSVDVAAWTADMAGTKGNTPLITPKEIAELCEGPMTRAELAKQIKEDCGCALGSAYRYIKQATKRAKTLKYNPKSKHYTKA